MINKNYLTWLAGFYEGEGTCGFYSSTKRNSKILQMSIAQKEDEVLIEIKNIFGYGHVSKHRDFKIKDRERIYKGGYAFSVQCNKAKDFLLKIRPFMRSTKKIKQLEKAIILWDNRQKGFTKESLLRVSKIRSEIAKIRRRNKKGFFIKGRDTKNLQTFKPLLSI